MYSKAMIKKGSELMEFLHECLIVVVMVLVQKFSGKLILSIISLKSEVAMMKNYFKGRHFQKDIILVAV
ncbi:hypothetical protein KBX30_12030, partial [Liquorilactobacillus satsumensis]|nr:hypothetical protein [Liquorilactobacillus satsumensis]